MDSNIAHGNYVVPEMRDDLRSCNHTSISLVSILQCGPISDAYSFRKMSGVYVCMYVPHGKEASGIGRNSYM